MKSFFESSPEPSLVRRLKATMIFVCSATIMIFITNNAHALSILDNVYAENCQADHASLTNSFSFKVQTDGKIARVNKFLGDLSIWHVKDYKETGKNIQVVYEQFIDNYQVTTNSIRLMSRLNTAGPNAYKFQIQGGLNVEKRETPSLSACHQSTRLYASYGPARQASKTPLIPIEKLGTLVDLYGTCENFQYAFLQNYYYAKLDKKVYAAYTCDKAINTDGRSSLKIIGRPGSQAIESFLYDSGSSCVFREHSNGVRKVYQASTFNEIPANPEDKDIELLCRAGYDGGDKEVAILKYESSRGECNATLKLAQKAERNSEKLELARLSERQGCKSENLKNFIKRAEIGIENERSQAVQEQKRLREYCDAKVQMCRSAKTIGRSSAEALARQLAVEVNSIRINRIEIGSCECGVVIYTPKGPLSCRVYEVQNYSVTSVSCD
jgi:hypothetical protein